MNDYITKNGSKNLAVVTYSINHQWYGYEIFPEIMLLLKVDHFEGCLNLT